MNKKQQAKIKQLYNDRSGEEAGLVFANQVLSLLGEQKKNARITYEASLVEPMSSTLADPKIHVNLPTNHPASRLDHIIYKAENNGFSCDNSHIGARTNIGLFSTRQARYATAQIHKIIDDVVGQAYIHLEEPLQYMDGKYTRLN